MSSRKITIKLNEKDLVNIMQELGKFKASRNFWNRSVLQITLDLTDSKETYEYLAKSKNILSIWVTLLVSQPDKFIDIALLHSSNILLISVTFSVLNPVRSIVSSA